MSERKPKAEYVRPPLLDSIEEMRTAIRSSIDSGTPLSAETLARIDMTLAAYAAGVEAESLRHVPGRPNANKMRVAAVQMHFLIERKGAEQEAAAAAVLPPGSPFIPALCKTYRTMRDTGECDALLCKLDDAYMQQFVQRLAEARTGNK
jgi:hypothetical protein